LSVKQVIELGQGLELQKFIIESKYLKEPKSSLKARPNVPRNKSKDRTCRSAKIMLETKLRL
jgi:hypothetical protein